MAKHRKIAYLKFICFVILISLSIGTASPETQ